MLAKTLLFNPAEPFVGRSAGRAVVGTINALIVGLIRTHMRVNQFGTAVAEPTLDSRNEGVEGAVQAAEMQDRMREDQGHALQREEPLKVAARLKLVATVIADSLAQHAGKRELANGQMIDDPWHLAQPFSETLNFMTTSVKEVSPTLIKETAKALGCSEEDVKKALAAQPQRDAAFLHRNKEEITEIYSGLIAADADGYLLKPESFEAVLEALPAMPRLGILASCDRALHREWERQVLDFTRSGNPLIKSNIGVLRGLRLQLREHIDGWMKDKDFMAEVSDAQTRGARIPAMGPIPAPFEPMEAEKAKERKAA